MTTQVDVFKGINQSKMTSVEKDSSHKLPPMFRTMGVKLFEDDFKRKRFVVEGISGLLLDKHNTVMHVVTVEDHQKMGYASGLLAAAKATLKTIRYDGNFSEAGKRLFKIEG